MPNDLDRVAAAAPKNVEITSVRITLQTLLNQTRKARESAAHIGISVWPVASHTRTLPGMAIIGVQARRGPAPALPGQRVHLPGCAAGCQDRSRSVRSGRPVTAASVCHLRTEARIFLARFYRRGNLHRRKTWHGPLGRPCLSAPGEHRARRNAIAARNLRHLRPWCQRLLDDPRLVILRPAPAAAPPRPKPRPASPDDLKARLKVTRFAKYHTSDKTALVGCVPANTPANSSSARWLTAASFAA
jgi:hypothetical protein